MAAVFPSHPLHQAAADLLRQATASQPAVFSRLTEISFLRLATTPALLRAYGAEGQTNRDAVMMLQALLALTQVVEIPEPEGTLDVWLRLADRRSASPKVWMDAYLAAFAIAGDLRLATLDSDFAAYKSEGLSVRLLARPRG